MMNALDLINEIERRLGWRASATIEGPEGRRSETQRIVLLLNRILKNLSGHDDWPMLHAEGTILTQAPVENSAIRLDLTNGSDVVSVSAFDVSGTGGVQATPFLLAHLYWAIQIGTSTPVYRIAEVVSPTQIKLNRAWIGDDNTPTGADDDVTYGLVMAMDQYALPEDFERPLGPWLDFLSAYKVTPKGPAKFRKIRQEEGTTITTGSPLYFTVYGMDPGQTFQLIHFHPWPDEQTMMEYTYIKVHPAIKTDRDLILFPDAQTSIVIEAVIYLANRDFEDDQRVTLALQEFMNQYNQTMSKNSLVQDTKQITPQVYYRLRSLRSTGRGIRYDYGDIWDRVSAGKLP